MRPLGNKIQLKIEEISVGAVKTDSIVEKASVVAVGALCSDSTRAFIGKTLFFKAWAVDVITDGKEKYYFISEDSDAICAIS